MLVYFVGGSLVITWIYNATGGSLLLTVLAHLAARLNNTHWALPEHVLPLVVHAVISVAIGHLALAPAVWRGKPRQPPKPVVNPWLVRD